jgi:hypothetical protein
MSPEVIGIYLVKTILSGAVGFILWITKSNHTKLQNTYTKKETDDMVSKQTAHLQKQVDDKFQTLLTAINLSTEERAKTNEMLHKIQICTAVVEAAIANLERRLDKKGD